MSYSAPWSLEGQVQGEPDESWLARLASVRRVTPEHMKQHLLDAPWKPGVFPEPPAVTRWRLQGNDETRGPTTSKCRPGAYCPLCFSADFRAQRAPYFRGQWQDMWSTACCLHGTPLFRWPYLDFNGHLVFWEWWSQVVQRGDSGPRREEVSRAYCVQLACARRMRRWMGERDSRALAWLQQLEQERLLAAVDHGPTYALTGLSASEVRRSAYDLVILLVEEFGSAIRCPASHMSTFLGPDWLFARRFQNGVRARPGGLITLQSFADPAQRRTLITLAMRLLASFAADPSFNSDGQLNDAGHTALIHDLRNAPSATWKWAARRARGWPDLVVKGIRHAAIDDDQFPRT